MAFTYGERFAVRLSFGIPNSAMKIQFIHYFPPVIVEVDEVKNLSCKCLRKKLNIQTESSTVLGHPHSEMSSSIDKKDSKSYKHCTGDETKSEFVSQ